jgi:uncharacterized membrane protein YbhN (UPF0104 family)
VPAVLGEKYIGHPTAADLATEIVAPAQRVAKSVGRSVHPRHWLKRCLKVRMRERHGKHCAVYDLLMKKRRVLRVLGGVLAFGLFVAAVWVLHRQLADTTLAQVVGALRSLPASRLAASLALMGLGYLALGGSDLLALRYLHRPLSLGKVVLASFISYAFANNLPFSFLVGGWVRYRFYSEWKHAAGNVRSVVLFTMLTYALGLATAIAIVFTLEPTGIPRLLNLPLRSTRPVGLTALACVAGYLMWSALRGKVRVRDVSFLSFFGIFLLGQLAALVAQVPGGLGVFEAVMLTMLRHSIQVPVLFGALVAYRVIYFLVPLVLATALLGGSEVRRWWKR